MHTLFGPAITHMGIREKESRKSKGDEYFKSHSKLGQILLLSTVYAGKRLKSVHISYSVVA